MCVDWGIPMPLSIQQRSQVLAPTVIRSRGLRSGVEKAIALGGDRIGVASSFLKAVLELGTAAVHEIERNRAGVPDCDVLRRGPLDF